ncbi:MAG: hypothetical protein V4621_06470 [Pseudomonadota bacterium]
MNDDFKVTSLSNGDFNVTSIEPTVTLYYSAEADKRHGHYLAEVSYVEGGMRTVYTVPYTLLARLPQDQALCDGDYKDMKCVWSGPESHYRYLGQDDIYLKSHAKAVKDITDGMGTLDPYFLNYLLK